VIPYILEFNIWWNFSEAGHGKSAAGGVGGTVKCLADGRVLTGQEIQNAAQNSTTAVQLFERHHNSEAFSHEQLYHHFGKYRNSPPS